MLNNIKLTLEYDGTNYYGWQKQKGFKTIQGEIEEAIELVTKEHCEVIGSSRTDAGVHARGFVANFKTNSKVPPNKFREALNVKLPNDIVITKSEQVDEEFHARYYAKGKTYEYYILNSDVPSALMRNQMYHYKYDLDVEAMKIAAKQFIGTHDFAAFKTQGSSVKGTIRTIFDVKVEKEKNIMDNMPGENEIAGVSDALKQLGDPSRLRIFLAAVPLRRMRPQHRVSREYEQSCRLPPSEAF